MQTCSGAADQASSVKARHSSGVERGKIGLSPCITLRGSSHTETPAQA